MSQDIKILSKIYPIVESLSDFKKQINYNTMRAFGICMMSFAIFVSAFFAYQKLFPTPRVFKAPLREISIGDILFLGDQFSEASELPESALDNTEPVIIGTTEVSGTPIPVPKLELDFSTEFASIGKIDHTLSRPGTIEPKDLDLDKIGPVKVTKPKIKEEEQYPGSEDIVSVAIEPQVDLAALQKSIVYPEMAKLGRVQGRVVVRVLVDKHGKPVKHIVEYSDNKMLVQAVVDAVMKATFTPAIQNETPVACWISIPISFKLK